MALAAKQADCLERDVLTSRADSSRTFRETLQKFGTRTTQMMTATRQSAQGAYKGTRTQIAQGFSSAATKTKNLARQTQHVARQAKQEHPLQLLAIVAGVAFVAGIAIRIQRSRTS